MPGSKQRRRVFVADIEEYGFHLTDAHVRITDRAHA